jgi:hypothetical protein
MCSALPKLSAIFAEIVRIDKPFTNATSFFSSIRSSQGLALLLLSLLLWLAAKSNSSSSINSSSSQCIGKQFDQHRAYDVE